LLDRIEERGPQIEEIAVKPKWIARRSTAAPRAL
jgi:hypothetical protein